MISVVIPLYNKATSIASTLDCVMRQSFADWEIVVVDDGSTDGSADIVDSIKDIRIRLIRQQNAGVSCARNKGVSESKGEFVAFLDADDEWVVDYLEKQFELTHKYPECDVFAMNYEFRDINGKKTSTIINKLPFNNVDGVLSNYFEVASYSHPPLWTSAIMVKKSALQSIGGFPQGIKSGEDLLTWARLACRYKIAYSTKIGAVYNLGDGYDFANKPPRRQDEGDPVGNELKKLFHEYKPFGFRKYIGHWHKMRSSVAIRYYDRKEAFIEAIKSFYYFPQTKIIPFIIMPILPKKILFKLFICHK